MDAVTTLKFLLGLGLLVAGAEALVRGAAKLAAAAGISSLVIGLTVVAYGTSSPEMAVSVKAALAGQADLSIGNVVGSNIFNVLFILGVSALIRPLVVSQQLVRRDVPIMLGTSILAYVMCLDGRLDRVDGAILFLGVVAYTVWSIRESRKETNAAVKAEYDAAFGEKERKSAGAVAVDVVLIVVGLGLLVLGSRWLVTGAIAMAKAFGVSELVVGLTIVAAGTSLPEVATSVLATIRGERDIAVGNVVGSNIFNILGVLGLSALVAPAGLAVSPSLEAFDAPVMLAVALACLPIFFTGHLIARWEGVVFLGYYAAYTAYLVFTAQNAAAAHTLKAAMLGFVLPLTVITLTVFALRSAERRKAVP